MIHGSPQKAGADEKMSVHLRHPPARVTHTKMVCTEDYCMPANDLKRDIILYLNMASPDKWTYANKVLNSTCVFPPFLRI